MIFVIMGMDVYPFDRLARAVDEIQRTQAAGEDVFVQLGSCTYEPKHARFERYLSFGAVCENIQNSSVVITHAGAGSTLVCIQQGKHPIVVPRSSRQGEIVDEHQVPFAEKLGRLGLATTVHEMQELPAAIASVRGKAGSQRSLDNAMGSAMGSAGELASWLEGFWQDVARKASR